MPLENINGTKLHFRISGKGIPVIFIHPPLLTSANFIYQHAELSDEFQVISFDIRGHGKSVQSDAPITYELISEDIKQLMDHLKIDKAFLCGYSTGGSIALEAMLTYPDRFYGGILVSAMTEASDILLRNRIRIASVLSGWNASFRMLRLGVTWGNADHIRTFRNLLNHSMSGNSRNIRQYYRYSLNYNCTERLSRIKAPVLLLYGEKDRGFKRYRKKLQQGLRNFEVVTLNKKTHQLPTKAAGEMNKAMRHWIHDVMRENKDSYEEEEANPMPEPFMIPPDAPEEPVKRL